MAVRLTQEEFISRSKSKFGDKFDYSKTIYRNVRTKIIVTCKLHGDFQCMPKIFLGGYGCPQCAIISKANAQCISNDTFIERLKTIHGARFSYDKTAYTKATEPVTLFCNEHQEYFTVLGARAYTVKGCQYCRANKKKTTKEFIEQAQLIHGNRYDYSKVKYVDAKIDVCIICEYHSEFMQRAEHHLAGSGCPICATIARGLTQRFSTSEFLDRAGEVHKGGMYSYENVNYIKNDIPIIVTCKHHGGFIVTPLNFLAGKGCPRCKASKGEISIRNYLDTYSIIFEEQKKFDECKYKKPLPFDFYIPKCNVLIEYQGIQHYEFSEFFYRTEKQFTHRRKLDKIKKQWAIANGFKFIEIRYDDNIEEVLNKEVIGCKHLTDGMVN